MSSPVVKKFIRKQRAEPTTPQGSTRAAAPTRLELFTPVYTTDQYGVKGEPTKQMMAKVCGPYQQREKLHELMTKFAGRNAYIVAKFKSPLPKSEQHYQMPQISPEAVSHSIRLAPMHCCGVDVCLHYLTRAYAVPAVHRLPGSVRRHRPRISNQVHD